MKAEYKRDLSGNYLVLYEEEEPDTSSYQMRMLVGNTIPSVLKCRVQGVDGQFMVCFDITSKQSVLSLYEEKKIGYEDLQMILGGFVQVMEEMAEYLLNPSRLLLKPEYMYVDVEKRQLYFCQNRLGHKCSFPAKDGQRGNRHGLYGCCCCAPRY